MKLGMTSFAAAALFSVVSFFAASPVQAAGEAVELEHQEWSWDGVLGGFDRQQLQRGFQIYREVCAACHGLDYIAFRNLEAIGYSEDQVKFLASQYEIEECCDEFGDLFNRPAIPADRIPNPYPNEQFARASNGGSLPPDLSLMTKARPNGPDYVYNLILGYQDPPADMAEEIMPGMYYNSVFDGNQIAMAQQLFEDLVEYSDGTPATEEQMAKDVTAFLHWAAEPKLEQRKQTGIRVLLFTFVFTVLAYFLKRRIWADVKH
jgi:ubiquinol-cytochrome c reductase cytochrome c1 subunit